MEATYNPELYLPKQSWNAVSYVQGGDWARLLVPSLHTNGILIFSSALANTCHNQQKTFGNIPTFYSPHASCSYVRHRGRFFTLDFC